MQGGGRQQLLIPKGAQEAQVFLCCFKELILCRFFFGNTDISETSLYITGQKTVPSLPSQILLVNGEHQLTETQTQSQRGYGIYPRSHSKFAKSLTTLCFQTPSPACALFPQSCFLLAYYSHFLTTGHTACTLLCNKEKLNYF